MRRYYHTPKRSDSAIELALKSKDRQIQQIVNDYLEDSKIEQDQEVDFLKNISVGFFNCIKQGNFTSIVNTWGILDVDKRNHVLRTLDTKTLWTLHQSCIAVSSARWDITEKLLPLFLSDELDNS
eukprot:UN32405